MNEKITQGIVIILLFSIMLLFIVYIFEVKEQTNAYRAMRDSRIAHICAEVCPLIEEMSSATPVNSSFLIGGNELNVS